MVSRAATSTTSLHGHLSIVTKEHTRASLAIERSLRFVALAGNAEYGAATSTTSLRQDPRVVKMTTPPGRRPMPAPPRRS